MSAEQTSPLLLHVSIISMKVRRRAVQHPVLGTLRIEYDKVDQNRYLLLETEQEPHGKLTWYFHVVKEDVSEEQVRLFQDILSHLDKLAGLACDAIREQLYPDRSQEFDVVAMYRLESVLIPAKISAWWEMDWLNCKDGFSHCIVEFAGHSPAGISVEA